jgi:hypothetical protein
MVRGKKSDRLSDCCLIKAMPAKTLRVIQDSKYTGIFTREQIRRAVRLATKPAPGESARPLHSTSAKSIPANGLHEVR